MLARERDFYFRNRPRSILGPAFDFALLRLSDHRILTYSQFGASAAVLREKVLVSRYTRSRIIFLKKHIFFKDSGYNFIVRDHPGKV